jgi:hypothetical protein
VGQLESELAVGVELLLPSGAGKHAEEVSEPVISVEFLWSLQTTDKLYRSTAPSY